MFIPNMMETFLSRLAVIDLLPARSGGWGVGGDPPTPQCLSGREKADLRPRVQSRLLRCPKRLNYAGHVGVTLRHGLACFYVSCCRCNFICSLSVLSPGPVGRRINKGCGLAILVWMASHGRGWGNGEIVRGIGKADVRPKGETRRVFCCADSRSCSVLANTAELSNNGSTFNQKCRTVYTEV